MRTNFGWAHYNSMQVQLNRRYIKGLQFALAYTLAKGWDTRVTSPYQTEDWFNRAPTAGTQLHNLTVSYTWDVPDGSRQGRRRIDAEASRCRHDQVAHISAQEHPSNAWQRG